MKLSELKKNPDNPRIIRDEKFARLKKSLKEFPQMMELRPIVVDENGVVLGGNMRLEALKANGHREIPDSWVKKASELTPEQKQEFIIKDNAGFGEWDWDCLANEWSDLPLSDWGVDIPEDWEPVETKVKEDESAVAEMIDKAAELQKKWDTKSGQLWEIPSNSAQGKKHRLLVGDSTEKSNVERLCANVRASMVLTDPPYGMDLDTDWSSAVGSLKSIGAKHKTTGKKYDRVKGDDAPFDPAHIFEQFGYCREIFLFGADYYAESIPDRTSGSWLVWDKRKESQADAIGSEFELCWSKAKHKRRMLRHDWFGFLSSENGTEARNRLHPTQKPTSLLRDIMEQWGTEGDVIVDVYAGSGATFEAAEQSNRVCYGIEFEPKYVAVTLERLSALGLTPKLTK